MVNADLTGITGRKSMKNSHVVHDSAEQVERPRCREALMAISEASLEFFESLETHDLKRFFQWVVDKMVALTDSEYGVIGEVLRDENGPFLKEHGITDIAWNDEMRDLYARYHAEGLEFHNTKSLYGEIIRTAKPLIANDPANHPKSGGLPAGHPPVRSFLGMPILGRHGTIIGIIGLANRPGGYSTVVVEELVPFAAMFAQMLIVHRSEQHRRELQEALVSVD